MDLGAVGQRRVVLAEFGQLRDVLVQRVALIEVVRGGGGVGADQIVVVVGGHLAREHVLPGILVPAVAGEALLVAVIDHRLTSGEVHQRMSQFIALQQHVRGLCWIGPQESADAPHVVIAEEGRRGIHIRIGIGVIVVIREQVP